MGDTIKAMTEAVRGRVVTPSDSDYDDARVVYTPCTTAGPAPSSGAWIQPT